MVILAAICVVCSLSFLPKKWKLNLNLFYANYFLIRTIMRTPDQGVSDSLF